MCNNSLSGRVAVLLIDLMTQSGSLNVYNWICR